MVNLLNPVKILLLLIYIVYIDYQSLLNNKILA